MKKHHAKEGENECKKVEISLIYIYIYSSWKKQKSNVISRHKCHLQFENNLNQDTIYLLGIFRLWHDSGYRQFYMRSRKNG